MTLSKTMAALATVLLTAALLVVGGGMAPVAKAQAGDSLSGYPTFDNTMTVSNDSWSDVLKGLWNSESNWYHCGDYHQIKTPMGVVSAYPYGPMSWGWFSGSGWTSEADPGNPKETVTSPNSGREHGDIQILYTNTVTTKSTNKIRFDCTGVYPGYETTGITVRSPMAITATTATIQAAVGFTNGDLVGPSHWHVEYGSAPGDYSQQSAVADVPTLGTIRREGATLPPITLTGLAPGTTYHYRVVFDENDNWSYTTDHPSYGGPNNTFTSAVTPQSGGTYGIATTADATRFIDVPNANPAVGLNLQLYDGNGSAAQQWTLVDDGIQDGFFKIAGGLTTPRLCLEIKGGSIPNNPIDQYTCDPNQPNQPNQLWQPVALTDGTFLVKSKDGLLLTSAGANANGTGLTAVTPTEAPTARQKWSFIPLRAGRQGAAAAVIGATRPPSRPKTVRCQGTARRCQARITTASGAVNRKITIRLPNRRLRLRSVKASPRREHHARNAQHAYNFSSAEFRGRRRPRFAVILNAPEWNPARSHVTMTFKAPRRARASG
jgi:hypothetical protein